MYQKLLQQPMSSELRASLTTGYALALTQAGQQAQAREELMDATHAVPTHESALSWLFTSIQTGHEDQAREAASVTDLAWPTANQEIQTWVATLQRQRSLGVWTLGRSATSLIRILMESAGETSRLILDGMALDGQL